MAPKAEIWVPKEVSEEDLEKLPIPVNKISPSSMAAFLKESHPSLKFNQDPTYSQIFDELRDLPPDKQEKLLVGFYSQGVEAFPNGKKLGEFLAELNNIRWFQPQSQLNREYLQKLSSQVHSRFNLPDLPLKIIEENWNAARETARSAIRGIFLDETWGVVLDEARGVARETARNLARRVVLKAARGAAWSMTRGVARSVVRSAAVDAALDASWGAEWIVVEDLMPQRGYDKGNPFEPLMEIYELGCWPIGIVPDSTGKEEIVVFIPPIQKTA